MVGTTDTQTLTNKTLTTPTIGSFTNATHAHTSYWNAYGGGLKKETSCIEFCKNLIDLLHAPHINETPPPKLKEVFVDLHSVTFYNSLILLKKKHIEHQAKPAHNDESWDPNFKWG